MIQICISRNPKHKNIVCVCLLTTTNHKVLNLKLEGVSLLLSETLKEVSTIFPSGCHDCLCLLTITNYALMAIKCCQ